MKKIGFSFISLIAGLIALGLLAYYLITKDAVPSLSDLMASSTPMDGTAVFPELQSVDIQAPSGTIHALVADTEAAQERGLGGRDSILPDQGMLFTFAAPDVYSFWMKDMLFPIDIVWIDGTKTVVGVTADIFPDKYPDMFAPPSPISYALELNAGQAARSGIATGTILKF